MVVLRAVCIMTGTEGVEGVVRMSQDQKDPKNEVKISGEITGLTPGLHGFHIHEYGDLTNGCTSAGEHLNPYGMTHGGPNDEVRHLGDLGNVLADKNGVARFEMTDNRITLDGEYNIIGRSFVVHSLEDDLGTGKGGSEAESKKTGNAGGRLACGVIALAKPQD